MSAREDRAGRERLILLHMPLVFHVARRMHAGLAGNVEVGDLVSAGTLGLIAAVDGFQVERGLAFSTYATHRIRGAILDELRRQDIATRPVRRRRRQITQAQDRLTSELGRPPRSTETAAELGIDMDTLWRWRDAAAATVPARLDPTSGERRTAWREDVLAAGDGRGPEEGLERAEDVAAVRRALVTLPERERTVLTLYYYEELNLRQIAEVLGLTESRISQIRTRAFKLLRLILG